MGDDDGIFFDQARPALNGQGCAVAMPELVDRDGVGAALEVDRQGLGRDIEIDIVHVGVVTVQFHPLSRSIRENSEDHLIPTIRPGDRLVGLGAAFRKGGGFEAGVADDVAVQGDGAV